MGVFNYAPHCIVLDPTKIDHCENQMFRESKQSRSDSEDGRSNIQISQPDNEYENDDDISENTICEDCENPENAFILPCEVLHILVWAKYQDQLYRPAKVMFAKFEGDNVIVCVQFFGDHLKAHVPDCDCFIYSEEYPNILNVPIDETYALSLKVGCIIHIFLLYKIIMDIFSIFLSRKPMIILI